MHTEIGYSSVHTYGKAILKEISCPKQPHSKIRHKLILLILPVFTSPLHGIMAKHGLSLSYIYMYAIGTSVKNILCDHNCRVNIVPPFSLEFFYWVPCFPYDSNRRF